MFVAVFTSFFNNGPRIDTPMAYGTDPETAIAYAKRILTEQENFPFEEYFDSSLNRKILFREVVRSGKGTVQEYGWMSAVRVPEAVGEPVFTAPEYVADIEASGIL